MPLKKIELVRMLSGREVVLHRQVFVRINSCWMAMTVLKTGIFLQLYILATLAEEVAAINEITEQQVSFLSWSSKQGMCVTCIVHDMKNDVALHKRFSFVLAQKFVQWNDALHQFFHVHSHIC